MDTAFYLNYLSSFRGTLYISQIEKGTRFRADEFCLQLATHLGCDPVELNWRVRVEKSPALVRMVSAPEDTSPTNGRIACICRQQPVDEGIY
jgi:hypothetical protein